MVCTIPVFYLQIHYMQLSKNTLKQVEVEVEKVFLNLNLDLLLRWWR